MENKTGRKMLEARYGKGCFMERAGIRKISKEEEQEMLRTIKGFKKLDRTITYHHIREKRNGGKVTIENGANIAAYNHQWLNNQPPEVQTRINQQLQKFKWEIDMARMAIGDEGLDFSKININIDMSDTIEIPVYDNSISKEKEARRKRFNRAKQKRRTQEIIDEDWER